MGDNNVLICGIPRSGTTLTCHLLNRLPDTVALHEPMRVKELAAIASHEERRARIEQFCSEQRKSLHDRKKAKSKNVGGQVPDNSIEQRRTGDTLRQSVASRGKIVIEKPLSPDFMLVVKHNSSFTAMLDGLVPHFPVYAIVRNPLAILGSWASVKLNVQTGHAPGAERFDASLKRHLEAISEPLERQVLLLDWFYAQYQRFLPDEAIIRYESTIESGGRSLSVIRPEAAGLDEPLASQNVSQLYGYETMLQIGERLLRSDGAWLSYYPRESVHDLLNELARRQAAAPQ